MVRGQLRDRAERRALSPVGSTSKCVLSVETASLRLSLRGAIPISRELRRFATPDHVKVWHLDVTVSFNFDRTSTSAIEGQTSRVDLPG